MRRSHDMRGLSILTPLTSIPVTLQNFGDTHLDKESFYWGVDFAVFSAVLSSGCKRPGINATLYKTLGHSSKYTRLGVRRKFPYTLQWGRLVRDIWGEGIALLLAHDVQMCSPPRVLGVLNFTLVQEYQEPIFLDFGVRKCPS
jgi:hypothetical protein